MSLPAARSLGLIALLLCVLSWVLFLDAPFAAERKDRHGDIGDEVACFQAKVAWNFVIHPLAVHRLWPLANEARAPSVRYADALASRPTGSNTGPDTVPDAARPYGTHPPLWSLLLAGTQAAFGREAWACRIGPLVLGLCSFGLFLLLARRTLRPATAWCALALFATLPLTVRHGTLPNYEPACQPFLLGAWLLYLRDPKLGAGTLVALAMVWLVGAWTDLGASYGFLTVLVDVLLFRSDLAPRKRLAVAFGGAAWFVLLLALVQLHAAFASGEPWSWRKMTGGAMDLSPDWPTFLAALWFHGRHLLTVPALVFAGLGLCAALPRSLRRGNTGEVAPLRPWLALLAVGVGNCLLLRRHALQHDFWLFYTGPAVAVLGAGLLLRVGKAQGAVLCVALALFQLASGIVLREGSLDPAARAFGVQLRACADGDQGDVILAPFRPGSERTVGFYARALVCHFVSKDDPLLRATWAQHGVQGARKVLVVPNERLTEFRGYLEQQFPGVEFVMKGGLMVADVTKFF